MPGLCVGRNALRAEPMSNSPAPTKPAATIVVLRDGADGMEMFMVVRHHQIDFASGALVFPGGKVDPGDYDENLLPHLTGAAADADMRAMQVAAIREAFEECGVLLAREGDTEDLVSGARVQALDALRTELNDGKLNITDFVRNNNLTLACDRLVHYAHWITPEMMPKRFDTHFFLAIAPADQLLVHDGYESVDSVWLSPRAAMEDAASGARTIIFPTLCNIEKIADHASCADAIAATQSSGVVPVLPWTEKREDGTYLCIPEEAGYPTSIQKMPERPPG